MSAEHGMISIIHVLGAEGEVEPTVRSNGKILALSNIRTWISHLGSNSMTPLCVLSDDMKIHEDIRNQEDGVK